MRVMVTGGGGYIGSVLIRLLLEMGYDVVCLDRFYFGMEPIAEIMGEEGLRVIKDDIRYFDPSILDEIDAVFDLASLSNDPSGELDPDKTLDINYRGRVRVARLAKKHGVTTYVLASSCSVYGHGGGVVGEGSKTNPLTTYAQANVLAEKDILPLSTRSFHTTALRQSTVYGLSPRMRFDLAINGMVLAFYERGEVAVMRDGQQWRPFVHVRDTSRAFIKVLESDPETTSGQVFNVGSNDQNVQILPLARRIASALRLDFRYSWYGSPDERSYRVDFSKIHNTLNFTPTKSIEDGAREIYSALESGQVRDDLRTRTVDWYRHLLDNPEDFKEVLYRGEVL